MHGEALVQLAMTSLCCSQKELATRMGVSPTQISKWKKGEHMSFEMEDKLRKLAHIGDKHPQFILWAGSLDEADKWERLIYYLASVAHDAAETGYTTSPLEDEEELLCWHTFYVLQEMGVGIPKEFPRELDLDYENGWESDDDDPWEVIDQNTHASLIYSIYRALNNVYGFYAAYVYDLMYDDDLDLMSTSAVEIEPNLLALAASKVEVDSKFAPKFQEFKRSITKDYEKWLTIAKDKAFRAGIPLKAELLDLVFGDDDALGQEAEAESLGFNASRIHPDIYMNELLTGMRTIHQVLPAIMKKLAIYDEFKLDTSELRIR